MRKGNLILNTVASKEATIIGKPKGCSNNTLRIRLGSKMRPRKNTKVMIVDDDFAFLKSFTDILSLKNFDTATAADGFKAIEKVKKMFFDCILMDVIMPGMNGVETFKKVKEISPRTRVIMMTAYSAEDLMKEALNEGAYGIVYKPLDIDKTVELMKNGLASEAGQEGE